MKLDQKYFVPFMLVVAVVTMVVIVFSSFNFQSNQEKEFAEKTSQYSELLTDYHPFVVQKDSISLQQLNGDKVAVVFWASWSDRSAEMMHELDELISDEDDLVVVAALVLDATETAEPVLPEHQFIYIDGTRLFNTLMVPGIPSYFLLNEEGEVVATHVGYKGNIKDLILNQFSNE